MILRETCDSASIELDMPNLETSMQEVDLSQTHGHARGRRNNNACLVPLSTLMDMDTVVKRHVTSTNCFTHCNQRVLQRKSE